MLTTMLVIAIVYHLALYLLTFGFQKQKIERLPWKTTVSTFICSPPELLAYWYASSLVGL